MKGKNGKIDFTLCPGNKALPKTILGSMNALGIDNYPSIDFYKNDIAVSMKTTRNSNPWSCFKQSDSKTGVKYNEKHLKDLAQGMNHNNGLGKFGTHPDLQSIKKVELDVFIREFDTKEATVVEWQKMVDKYLTDNGYGDLIGKIKVNLLKLEENID